jgi:hypothetical protein
MNEVKTMEPEIITSLVINGDLSKLSPTNKVEYYRLFCERLGLDPLTQPFKILKLNGKEVMYCDRSGAQQLNKKHNVSHEIKSRETMADLYVVTCRASLPDGRYTDSIGAVAIKGLSGDNLANAMMKCETKSKRRATLDLLGLGILDETETVTIPGAETVDVPYSCDDLKTEYLRLLQQYGDLVGIDKMTKLNPDNWKKEQNSENFLAGIKFLKEKIENERLILESNLVPHTVEDIGKAARAAADKDDFYERKKK